MPSLPAKMKILSILAKTIEKQKLNFFRSALFHMETRVSLKYLWNGCKISKKDKMKRKFNRNKKRVTP